MIRGLEFVSTVAANPFSFGFDVYRPVHTVNGNLDIHNCLETTRTSERAPCKQQELGFADQDGQHVAEKKKRCAICCAFPLIRSSFLLANEPRPSLYPCPVA